MCGLDGEMREVKSNVLAHYDRMIDWAKGQDPHEKAEVVAMYKAIGEAPNTEGNALCQRYYDGDDEQDPCNACPSASASQPLCRGTPYEYLVESLMSNDPWEDVLGYLRDTREYFSCLVYYRE